jgi:hypothetical protein
VSGLAEAGGDGGHDVRGESLVVCPGKRMNRYGGLKERKSFTPASNAMCAFEIAAAR